MNVISPYRAIPAPGRTRTPPEPPAAVPRDEVVLQGSSRGGILEPLRALGRAPLAAAALTGCVLFGPTPALAAGAMVLHHEASLSTVTHTAFVNLDDQPMRLGAHGDAVREMQRGLARFVPVPPSGVYDAATEQAVTAFQATNHLAPDGVMGARTFAVLWSRLFWEKGVALELNRSAIRALPPHLRVEVDLSQQRARLVNADNGDVVRSYPISSGTAEYPTPRGTFHIGEIREKPSWYPPHSAWVRNPAPVGPGIHNPLGPAKMRLGTSSILLHGVSLSEIGSIGRRSASHGCVRMFPQDAWELHRILHRGTEVIIRPGPAARPDGGSASARTEAGKWPGTAPAGRWGG